jgi:hypothetical protein
MPTETLKRDGKADIEAATTSSFVIPSWRGAGNFSVGPPFESF